MRYKIQHWKNMRNISMRPHKQQQSYAHHGWNVVLFCELFVLCLLWCWFCDFVCCQLLRSNVRNAAHHSQQATIGARSAGGEWPNARNASVGCFGCTQCLQKVVPGVYSSIDLSIYLSIYLFIFYLPTYLPSQLATYLAT